MIKNNSLNTPHTIKIFDLNNRLIKVVEGKGNKSIVNVKEIPKGLYIIKIYYGNEIKNQKLLIER